jgi:flagellar biosynthesis protein FliP
MKSAYELAMERLGGESHELTKEQKQALAEIDSKAKASIAETEIMFDQQLATESDPAKAALIQKTRQQQIEKIRREAEEEKESVRKDSEH